MNPERGSVFTGFRLRLLDAEFDCISSDVARDTIQHERGSTYTVVIISKDEVREPLHVIVPISNPWRWKSRVKLAERALKHFHDSGAIITLVEVAFNRREFVFKDFGLNGAQPSCRVLGDDHKYRHRYIGMRSDSELWLKENMINIGVNRLMDTDPDWKQMMWADSDIMFVRPNWVGETIHKLQHYKFLQPFSDAQDVGPNNVLLSKEYPHAVGSGFATAWERGDIKTTLTKEILADLKTLGGDIKKLKADFLKLEKDICELDYYEKTTDGKRVFPGLAWACTREAWQDVGGLLDVAIWGGGDWHMSHALIEKTEGMMRPDLHRNYKKKVMQWYERCRTNIRCNVGSVEGTVLHYWHGKKIGRGYNKKHEILARFGFDPERHLKRDYQGLYQLHDDRSTSYVQIRDMMRVVAKERDEDDNHI